METEYATPETAPTGRRFAGKAALITGGDRGTGQAQAVRLAAEGADVAVVVLSGAAEETVRLVKPFGGRISVHNADVRDLAATQRAVDAAVAELGRLDVLCATAGVNGGNAPLWELDPAVFRNIMETNIFGTWHVLRAAVPHLLRQGPGGAVVVMGSTTEARGVATAAHYAASKHGVLGLMRSLAAELGPRGIRVNGIVPTNIDTVMFHNPETYALLLPGVENPDREQVAAAAAGWHELPVGWVGGADIAAATAYLASDEARYVTGSSLRVDAGLLNKWPG
ncbi:SDR family oxidoreductase [Nocardia sp. alder85J]|uniref:SDR family oxidoreductase n=1 Tax=Nocardia sp. alder85J TaxID=2862949 RepID=UPI001CD37D49|nr:SDR family oxidoreductase [Nocardia sp. alder85J]MCX4097508.1 SDR family oxidoreductase [Nocardia sp. alder85J]